MIAFMGAKTKSGTGVFLAAVAVALTVVVLAFLWPRISAELQARSDPGPAGDEVATIVYPEDAPVAGVGVAGDLQFADGCVYIDTGESMTSEENGVTVKVGNPLILMLPEGGFTYDGTSLTITRFARTETYEDGDHLEAGGNARVLSNLNVEHTVPTACSGDGVLLVLDW